MKINRKFLCLLAILIIFIIIFGFLNICYLRKLRNNYESNLGILTWDYFPIVPDEQSAIEMAGTIYKILYNREISTTKSWTGLNDFNEWEVYCYDVESNLECYDAIIYITKDAGIITRIKISRELPDDSIQIRKYLKSELSKTKEE